MSNKNTGLFYIVSQHSPVGEHVLWWNPNRAGYTTHLNKAGKYTKAEADDICSCGSEAKAFPVELVDSVANVMVETHALRNAERKA